MLHEIDLSRVDLNLLVLFEAVLEELHVGRAANRLNLSPSAVSHGLGRMRRLLNDPVFLRTPKGVTPTARALELAEPIASILAGARRVISTAEPFEPATSSRHFTIGAPDGVSAVFLPPLLARLRMSAPNLDLRIRQVLPEPGRPAANPWESALQELDSRALDIAVGPFETIPARFVERILYEEEFAIVTRPGHPYASAPTLDGYCELKHVVVSLGGDAHGFVDDALAAIGRRRRVVLTVPNFFMALAFASETDFLTAVPGTFAAAYGKRFGVVSSKPPFPLPVPGSRIRAVAPKVAMMDAGVAWLFNTLTGIETASP